MWKCFPRNIREKICFQRCDTPVQDINPQCIFSRRFLSPLTQHSSHSESSNADRVQKVVNCGNREDQNDRRVDKTFGQDPRGSCRIITKVIPSLTQLFHFSSSKECNINKKDERTKCGWKKHQKYKQQERTWKSDNHVEHTWLGALGWSSALVLGWYMIQPLCHFWFRPHDDKERKCHRLKHLMCGREGKHHRRHDTCYMNLAETLYKTALSQPLFVQSKQDVETVYDEPDGTSIPLRGSDVPLEPSASEVQISHIYYELPTLEEIEINGPLKDLQLDEIQITQDTYGPQTPDEAIDEAAGNFMKVHNSSIGDIGNQLGVKFMQHKKYKEAVAQFKKAVEYENAAGTYNLGVCYEKGLGISQDFKEAAKYYQLASERGHATAMYNLGVFYVHGWGGLPVDCNRAHELFEKASALGQSDAKRALDMKAQQDRHKEKEIFSDNSTNLLLQALGIIQNSSLNLKHKIAESQNINKNQENSIPHIPLTDGQQVEVKDFSHLIQDAILKYSELRQK